MSATEELNILVKSSRYVRQRVTRSCNEINNNFNNLSSSQRSIYNDKLQALKIELCKLNKEIFPLPIKAGTLESDIDAKVKEEEEYDDRINENLTRIRLNGRSRDENTTTEHGVNTGEKLKLPQVPLPTFSNANNESLRKFLRSLECILGKHNLTSYAKFVYLRNQLSDGPRALVDSLDVEEQSYEVAKTLLEKAFDNKIVAKYDIISRLSKLKLAENADCYSYIGEMRTVLAGVDSLNITVEDILQYFIWCSFNTRFQEHLVHITNSSKPSLEEIKTNIFEATTRYMKQTEIPVPNHSGIGEISTGKTEKSVAMAVNVKGTYKFCNLCQSDSRDSKHELRRCTIYDTVHKKVEKLKSLNWCTKCSFKNHSSDRCKFKFASNCRNCSGKHMTFLCLKNSRSADGNVSTNVVSIAADTDSSDDVGVSTVTVGDISTIEANQSVIGGDIFLPTFTADIGNDKAVTVRVFKDGGCQRNFINSKIAADLNLKIVNRNVTLNIRGFNSNRPLVTNIVAVPITIGDRVYDISAVCVKDIPICFPIKNCDEVFETFIDRGYSLADKFLLRSRGTVKHISMILGAESDHILPMKSVVFGRENAKSAYIETPIGIMFSGRIENILSNLHLLEEHTLCAAITEESHGEIVSRQNMSSSELFRVDGALINVDSAELNYDEEYEKSTEYKFEKEVSFDDEKSNPCETETNLELVKFVLNCTERDSEGRLISPITWNGKNAHLLGMNYNLSLRLLKSNLNKLKGDPLKLQLYNEVFKKQLQNNIVEKITNVDQFVENHPSCSFMPHMGVFKMNRDTTKCRVVFLSNMCEPDLQKECTVSHNQCILPGPSLNHKISTAIAHIRFDTYLLTFDLSQAFLTIGLKDYDSDRLMFLWFNDCMNGDYSVVAYRSLRLCFGLRCSPCILMLAMYRILILDQSEDESLDELKTSIYNSIYMDNGSLTTCNEDDLLMMLEKTKQVFGAYQFKLQQFYTNSEKVQTSIDAGNDKTPAEVKLFGLVWNRATDTLCCQQVQLSVDASTKREVLRSLNSIYDVHNVYGPILLRARLFMQTLQYDKSLLWDTSLPASKLSEWVLIAKHANNAPKIEIPRFVGKRTNCFQLIAFTDSSRESCGVVVYIKDLCTNRVTYFESSMKVLSRELKKKSIPALECFAISFGARKLLDCYDALAGDTVVSPISVTKLSLFTDSMVCLHWLHSYIVSFEKLQKVSVFVRNKLREIDEVCHKFPVTFDHVAGRENPADFLTKVRGYKSLLSSGFYTGPQFLTNAHDSVATDLSVIVPNPQVLPVREIVGEDIVLGVGTQSLSCVGAVKVVPFENFSCFSRLVSVYKIIFKFVFALKRRIGCKDVGFPSNLHNYALSHVITVEQQMAFPEVFEYLNRRGCPKKTVPSIVSLMNLFVDSCGLIRVIVPW